MTVTYPFYTVYEGEDLEQGDILMDCPVILPVADVSLSPTGEVLAADRVLFDVILMTQSCDLANDKIDDVIVCPHFALREVKAIDAALADRNVQKQILRGYRFRYSMLAASVLPEMQMEVRVVDFGRVFSLPKAFVRHIAAGRGKRLRLCSPYKEHLSQAFARFFMRVGLPQDIELPE